VELRQTRESNRRSDIRKVVTFLAVVVMIGLGVELGRAYLYMQDVQKFVQSIERQTPNEVRSRVAHFAEGLSDRNPLIRRAAMMAMKLATGWRCGSDPSEWRRFWLNAGADWQFGSTTGAPHVVTRPAWLEMVPTPPTNAPSAP
jgi:hypothetical protein